KHAVEGFSFAVYADDGQVVGREPSVSLPSLLLHISGERGVEEGRVIRDEKISPLQRVAELPSEHRQLQLSTAARPLARVRPTQPRARAGDRQPAHDQRRESFFKGPPVEAAGVIQLENRQFPELDEERAVPRERTLRHSPAARARTPDDVFKSGDRLV